MGIMVFSSGMKMQKTPRTVIPLSITLLKTTAQLMVAMDFPCSGNAQDVLIQENIIRDTGPGNQIGAIFINKGTPPVKLENNTMSGHKQGNVIYGR